MAQGEFIAGYFTPLEKPNRPDISPPAGGIGGKPPLTKPPLPPGVVPPIHLPELGPGTPEQPIFIPDEPGQPLPLPPGTVWPPFNPGDGLSGKLLLLAWVPGVGSKWIVVEVPPMPGWPPAGGIGGTPPPRPTPAR